MSAKHTKGPWRWSDVIRENELKTRTLDAELVSVLFHEAAWDVTAADRALIAAAPDLADALVDVLDGFDGGDDPRFAQARAALRAAGRLK